MWIHTMDYIDVHNVKHSRYICDNCGCAYDLDDEKYNYCPNCGANMDAEDDGGNQDGNMDQNI